MLNVAEGLFLIFAIAKDERPDNRHEYIDYAAEKDFVLIDFCAPLYCKARALRYNEIVER